MNKAVVLLPIFISLCLSVSAQFSTKPAEITPSINKKPPSDANILFDKGNLDKFESMDGAEAKWIVKGKKFTVNPGTGNILTKERFRDFQLHIEWRTPKKDVKEGKTGQKNGNSGIYIMGKYEVQVLNSFQNETDPDRQAGAVYKYHKPLVNASLEAGKWQTYDIIFTAPEFDMEGNVSNPGMLTVFHNGVLIQYNSKITKPTIAHNENLDLASPELPIMLQDHTNEVSYRNIWIRKL